MNTTSYPARRLEIAAAAPRQIGALVRFGAHGGLDPTIAELVALRVSQLNGCAFCIDMHWKDARAAGEEEARLYSLDAWRESPFYDPRERAALALCEAVTLIHREGVPDPVWEEAAARFGEAELGRLLCAIAATNTWNRLQIATRAEPGHYRPGDLDGAAPADPPATSGGAAAAGVDPEGWLGRDG